MNEIFRFRIGADSVSVDKFEKIVKSFLELVKSTSVDEDISWEAFAESGCTMLCVMPSNTLSKERRDEQIYKTSSTLVDLTSGEAMCSNIASDTIEHFNDLVKVTKSIDGNHNSALLTPDNEYSDLQAIEIDEPINYESLGSLTGEIVMATKVSGTYFKLKDEVTNNIIKVTYDNNHIKNIPYGDRILIEAKLTLDSEMNILAAHAINMREMPNKSSNELSRAAGVLA